LLKKRNHQIRLKRNLQTRHKKNDLGFAERTTRLILVLTILGGGLGVISNFFWKFFVYVFSTRLYLSQFIGYEHIFALCLGVSLSMVIINIIVYIWREFNSLNIKLAPDKKDTQRIDDANQAYGNIFKSIYTNSLISFIMFVFFIIFRNFYIGDQLVICLTYGFAFIILVVLIIAWYLNRRQAMVLFGILVDKCKNISALLFLRFFIFIGVSIFWFIIGIGIMNSKQSLDININEDSIIFNSKNFAPENVAISFISFDQGNKQVTKQISLKRDDFKVAYQEVVESQSTDFDLLYKLRKLPSGSNQSIQLGNTEYNYMYKLNYKKYIQNGDNYIHFVVDTKAKKSVFVTPLTYINGKYEIQQNEFHIR
jgi:hypothetical protein